MNDGEMRLVWDALTMLRRSRREADEGLEDEALFNLEIYAAITTSAKLRALCIDALAGCFPSIVQGSRSIDIVSLLPTAHRIAQTLH